MAVLLRCSPSPPLPSPNPSSALRPSFAGAALPGFKEYPNLICIPRCMPKTQFKKAFMRNAGFTFSSGVCFISSSLNSWITAMEGGSENTNPVPHFFTPFMKNCSAHKMLPSVYFPMVVFLAHMPNWILPPEAMAETCESNSALFNMPLLLAIALVGATVGGLLARQRKGELARLNEQLRQINAALRRQAKIESYAPNLSYAPVSKVPETEVIVDPRKEQLIMKLRTGKNFLRNQDPEKAYGEFKFAFDLAGVLGDHIEEKKAARGLGASLQRQGNYREAIKYHSKVLEIAKRTGEDSGSTEAYGAIADCYTELGDLERAAKFYDKYIARLESD